MGILSVGISAYAVLLVAIAPLLTSIEAEFRTDQSTASWLLSIYLLVSAIATPVVGRVGDSYGKRRTLVATLSVVAFGALVATFAQTIEMMIAARVIQGVGGGALPLAFSIVRDQLPPERVGRGIAVLSSLVSVTIGASVVIAGPIDDLLGFRWIFVLAGAMAGGSAVATALLIQESRVRTLSPVRVLPAALLAGWLVAVLLGTSNAPGWGWGSTRVLGLLAAGLMLCIMWCVVELRIDVPLIDLRLMVLPGVWTANLVSLLMGMALFAGLTLLPQMNQTPPENGYGFGASVTLASIMMLPHALMSFTGALISGWVLLRGGLRSTLLTGCLVLTCSPLLVVVGHGYAFLMYLAAGFSGLGVGLLMATLNNAVIAAVPVEHTGMASGMTTNVRTLGGAIGTSITVTVVTAHLGPSGFPEERGYVFGFAFLALMGALAATSTLLIPNRLNPPVAGQ